MGCSRCTAGIGLSTIFLFALLFTYLYFPLYLSLPVEEVLHNFAWSDRWANRWGTVWPHPLLLTHDVTGGCQVPIGQCICLIVNNQKATRKLTSANMICLRVENSWPVISAGFFKRPENKGSAGMLVPSKCQPRWIPLSSLRQKKYHSNCAQPWLGAAANSTEKIRKPKPGAKKAFSLFSLSP